MYKKLALFLFIFVLLASASGAWTRTVVDGANDLLAIHGYEGTSVATLCAVGRNGAVWRSTDYGNNWTSITSVPIIGTTHLSGVAVTANAIYAAGTHNVSGGHIFKYDNSTSSWSDITPTDTTYSSMLDVSFSGNKGIVCGGAVAGGVVRYTTDGGTTWNTPITSPPVGNSYLATFYFSDNSVWVAGSGGNIYKSTDGGKTWTQKYGTGSNIHAIYFADASHGYAVDDSSNFYYTSDGNSWNTTTITTISDNWGVYAPSQNEVWVAGYIPPPISVVKMTYSGGSWSETSVYTSSTVTDLHYDIFGFDQDNMWVVGHGGSGIVVSNVATPTVTSVTNMNGGSAGAQNTTQDYYIDGTNFQVGQATFTFSPAGITVNNWTRLSSTRIRINATISPTATVGLRNVTVTINGNPAVGSNVFSVNLPPDITVIAPPFAPQGWMGTLAITGTSFQTGASFAFVDGSGNPVAGITIGNATVNSATSATAYIIDSSNAPRTVYLKILNGDGGVDTHAFSIASAGPPPTFNNVWFDGQPYGTPGIPHPVDATVNVKAVATGAGTGFPANPVGRLWITDSTGNFVKMIELPSSAMSVSGNQLTINYRFPATFALQSPTTNITIYTEGEGPGRFVTNVVLKTGDGVVGYAYPNPYRGTGNLDLQFWMPSVPPFEFKNIRATVFNLQGMRVWESNLITALSGKNTITWDGITNIGARLANGPYLAVIQDGSRTWAKIKVFVAR
jgi:hypothetical protein